ncbi:phytanoyl-CoA dioxygenase family protein [Acaryochloris sp. IP29b_bin.148]|uniref:phytanoyl-CoA dioxygenase family protein n=1 Tax=Acaryochloris sp. IP29b_bin.148 TaxID=2969218 RepID=UPI0026332AB4|nr:phytanoyl-CoA dioxygenase family protein [Acaryochloris sp. IP29b_bin.148]
MSLRTSMGYVWPDKLCQQFDQQGYVILPQIWSPPTCNAVCDHLAEVPQIGPGTRRLLTYDWYRSLAKCLKSHPLISPLLGAAPIVNQCTYFAKSPDQNWLVALHQDVSIAVQPNAAATRWGLVNKEGLSFVQPPVEVLAQLVALRVHLDDCTSENGPLKVVPGSHQQGRLTDAMIAQLRDDSGEIACLIPKGGVLAMRPLLLHASSKMIFPQHRRVLHFLCGPRQLPHGLVWHEAF